MRWCRQPTVLAARYIATGTLSLSQPHVMRLVGTPESDLLMEQATSSAQSHVDSPGLPNFGQDSRSSPQRHRHEDRIASKGPIFNSNHTCIASLADLYRIDDSCTSVCEAACVVGALPVRQRPSLLWRSITCQKTTYRAKLQLDTSRSKHVGCFWQQCPCASIYAYCTA